MHEQVQVSGESPASPENVWRLVSGFDVGWHPFVAWSQVSVDPSGVTTRRFAAQDAPDDIVVERLTHISHSDRTLSYDMVSGIKGAARYQARLGLSEGAHGGTRITWRAEIDADAARAGEIAAGTRAVFEAGIAALATPPAAAVRGERATRAGGKPVPLGACRLEGPPGLGLSVAPAGTVQADTLCLLLHGIGGNRGNWDAQLGALGALMPTVAMDLRGYGESDLGAAPSRVEAYCADINAVMAHFGAKKLILGGLSYGAWLAASFALRHPDKIAGLILCGGCTGMSEAAPQEREAFRQSREVPLDAGQTPADFASAVVDIIAGPGATPSQRRVLHESMAAIAVATYRDALNCFCNPPGKLDFGRAAFPVLLLTGAHDRLAPPDEIRAVSQRFADAGAPFARFEEIADAGHVCNLEQPGQVNRIIADFLRPLIGAPVASTKAVRKSEKRARILASALREFSAQGYSGASMRAIAERAAVSKPTIYQYFGQKDALFAAVLDLGKATILAPIEAAEDADMIDVLWAFAWAYADYVLQPENLSIARLIIGEAERIPEVARAFHETGPARVRSGLATYLAAQREAGRLTFEDADMAAGDLWSLILSEPRSHALHFPQLTIPESDLFRAIRNGLSVFLKAYATTPQAALARLDQIAGTRPRKSTGRDNR